MLFSVHDAPNVFDQFKAADMNAYREYAGTVLWQLPGVLEKRNYAVMDVVKNTTALAM
jgi:Lrp/AsnC family leucine-responsive transcriptional regulator